MRWRTNSAMQRGKGSFFARTKRPSISPRRADICRRRSMTPRELSRRMDRRRPCAKKARSRLPWDGVIADSGLTDLRDEDAQAVLVARLPGDIITYLNGSRYCQTDKLVSLAWNAFGHLA